MGATAEVEIKFRAEDLSALAQKLQAQGFHLVTPRTHEMNTLYDTPEGKLRSRGELLRLRLYGATWTLTHKGKGAIGKHKTRQEIETRLEDGDALASVFTALGLVVSFRYEKYRSEWSDGKGHVVLDQTPIGNIAEIEGEPGWIDAVAKRLGLHEADYITQSYAQMFFDWKRQTGSPAQEMTWNAVEGGAP